MPDDVGARSEFQFQILLIFPLPIFKMSVKEEINV